MFGWLTSSLCAFRPCAAWSGLLSFYSLVLPSPYDDILPIDIKPLSMVYAFSSFSSPLTTSLRSGDFSINPLPSPYPTNF